MEREQGYYWILIGHSYEGFKWEIAEWDGFYWYRAGSEREYQTEDFKQINETRLTPPE